MGVEVPVEKQRELNLTAELLKVHNSQFFG
jgi:hypothetical protein